MARPRNVTEPDLFLVRPSSRGVKRTVPACATAAPSTSVHASNSFGTWRVSTAGPRSRSRKNAATTLPPGAAAPRGAIPLASWRRASELDHACLVLGDGSRKDVPSVSRTGKGYPPAGMRARAKRMVTTCVARHA
jgi:hypothetical protein